MGFLLHPNPTAQFYALITQAQTNTRVYLKEDIESYLVFLLMHFSQKPEITSQALGLRFLEAYQTLWEQPYCLREIADNCLLFAGLFPEYAQRRRVSVRYFIDLGQSAYAGVAERIGAREGTLYQGLSLQFVALTGVLQATRDTLPLPTLEAWLHSLDPSNTSH